MSIFRVIKDPNNPYVMINKAPLNDPSISWKAKGLLCYMLSMPDDWQFYESELVKHSRDGRDSFRSAIKELTSAGYVVKGERFRDDKGLLRGYEYSVYENSIHSGKSNVGLSNVGKPTTTNNNLTNNDYNNILHHTTCDGYPLINLLNEYSMQMFGKEVRQHNGYYDFEVLTEYDSHDVFDILEEAVTKYDQCNLDYLQTIEHRFR